MKYPKFIKKGDCFGIVAPSFTIDGNYYIKRYQKALEHIENYGFKYKEAPHIYNEGDLLFSPSFEVKANDLINAYMDQETQVLWSVAGGEVMTSEMPYLDFDKIKESEPKWFLGYSDNTVFGYLLTTLCDVASIYTYNFTNIGEDEIEKSKENVLAFLTGKLKEQTMFTMYDSQHLRDEENPTRPYEFTDPTCWKSLSGNDEIIRGRLVGGCLDILLNIIGTKYDNFLNFKEKYKNDGIVLFVESCDLNILSQFRAFNQLECAGWLKGLKGIIIGRPLNREPMFDKSYEEILHTALDHLNIPVIYDFDVGHTSPDAVMVNGSVVEIKLENKKGSMKTLLI